MDAHEPPQSTARFRRVQREMRAHKHGKTEPRSDSTRRTFPDQVLLPFHPVEGTEDSESGFVYQNAGRDCDPEQHYRRHPDRKQEQFFFGLLRECMDKGIITEDMLRDEMRRNHVRHDAFEVLDDTPRLTA